MPPFTPRQGQYLAFIDRYTRRHGVAPAEMDIAVHFQVSPPSAHMMVVALENRGFIRREPGVPRSIEILVPLDSMPPLAGSAEANKPTPETFEQQYPSIAKWLRYNRIEIGYDEESNSLIRAHKVHLDRVACSAGTAKTRVGDALRQLDDKLRSFI